MALRSLLAVALLCSASSAKPIQWEVDGHFAADTADHKVVDGFGVYLALVPEGGQVLEEYATWTGKGAPLVPFVDSVSDGEEFDAIVLYGGCGRDQGAGCVVSVDYRIYRPDGTLYAQRMEPPMSSGAVPAPRHTFVARSILPMRFTIVDERGPYRITARVRDLNRGIDVDVESAITLKEGPVGGRSRPN